MGGVHDHRYVASLSWSGSTAAGYDGYLRTHEVTCPPATARLHLSADGAFCGDVSLLNPEQLLVAAASSCQLLSFLAVAARARLDVVSYRDEAEGLMPAEARPSRLTRITLRPRVVLASEASRERLAHLAEVAHRECYVASSLACEVVVVPTFLADVSGGTADAPG
jgi:organic hydroperoxide reductase OsmC/OhrA